MNSQAARTVVVLLHLLAATLLLSTPLSAQTILNFPRVVSSAEVFTGIAVVNPTGAPATVTFTAYEADGLTSTGILWRRRFIDSGTLRIELPSGIAAGLRDVAVFHAGARRGEFGSRAVEGEEPGAGAGGGITVRGVRGRADRTRGHWIGIRRRGDDQLRWVPAGDKLPRPEYADGRSGRRPPPGEVTISVTNPDPPDAEGTRSNPLALAVTVVNPAPGEGTSNGLSFTIRAAPGLSAVAPASGALGVSTPIEVTGSDFELGSEILFNGVPIDTGFNTATSLSGTILSAASGTFPLTVRNLDGQLSNPIDFTVLSVPNPVPDITSISSDLDEVETGDSVQINGSGFIVGTQVFIDGVLINADVVTGSVIRFTAELDPGSHILRVTNPPSDGGGGGSALRSFTTPARNLAITVKDVKTDLTISGAAVTLAGSPATNRF